ncbi:hypothetical protein NQ561_17155 [Anaerostipes caccae L1-92]|nr:hypothetical protein [Anaerostipes caccae]UWN73356.1 hypothetical protein NQ561_17155 [Anaerostipes caccae L1-92]
MFILALLAYIDRKNKRK